MQRFSRSELINIRNGIDIKQVIENLLKIPAKTSEGSYRFLCPKCQEMLASVNTETNLSRCFRCNKNFNTIELVMEAKKLTFVDSVKLLKNSHF